MDGGTTQVDRSEPTRDEVFAVARGIASAVAPPGGVTEPQAALLGAVTMALTGVEVDYQDLEPLEASELAAVLESRSTEYRHRIVHHMVLAELILVPLPAEVAARVVAYAEALGVDDNFVRIARQYASGTLGVAWCDLRRSGFTDRWDQSNMDPLYTKAQLADPFDAAVVDPQLAARWTAFAELPSGTLGRATWDMYQARAFDVPGAPGGASAYLAQHDFVHILADVGTNLEGELEVFALIGRADPDPRGFSWLATVVGLFETGYVHQQGFLQMDVEEHSLRAPGMTTRLGDSIRRGKHVAEHFGTDLLSVDYHQLAPATLDEAREHLHLPPKSPESVAAGSPSVTDLAGMSVRQRAAAAAREHSDS